MRRLLAQTLSIQSLGMVLMFVTTLMVARLGGTEVQGKFAVVKSITDLQVALFSLGLPSALVYVLNRTERGHRQLYRSIMRYALALVMALPLVNYAIVSGMFPELIVSDRWSFALMLGVSGALGTGFALLRGLYLVREDGPLFSFVSILPWIIIAATIALLIEHSPRSIEIAYAGSAIVSIGVISFLVKRTLPPGRAADDDTPLDWALLRSQAAMVFAQGMLFALQGFLTNVAMESLDPTLVAAGLFNVASLAIVLPNLLVAMVAPVLFNRWTKTLDLDGFLRIRRGSLLLAAALQGLAILSLPLVPFIVALVFGPAFAGATEALSVLLLSLFAVAVGRVLTPAIQSLGGNAIVTLSCVARLMLTATACLGAFAAGAPPLLAAAIGWTVGEYAALLVLLLSGTQKLGRANQVKAATPTP